MNSICCFPLRNWAEDKLHTWSSPKVSRSFCKNWSANQSPRLQPAFLSPATSSSTWLVAPRALWAGPLLPGCGPNSWHPFSQHKEEVHLIVLFIFLRKAFSFHCLCEQCLSFLVSFWRAETCEFLRRLKESLVPGTVSKLIQVKPHFLPEWTMSQTPSPLNNETMS